MKYRIRSAQPNPKLNQVLEVDVFVQILHDAALWMLHIKADDVIIPLEEASQMTIKGNSTNQGVVQNSRA